MGLIKNKTSSVEPNELNYAVKFMDKQEHKSAIEISETKKKESLGKKQGKNQRQGCALQQHNQG